MKAEFYKSFYLILTVLILFFASPYAQAVEIRGKVMAVSGETVTIKLESDLSPNIGDKVKISFTTPDGDKIPVGEWKVSKVTGKNVTATKVEGAEANIEMDAVIYSDKPKKIVPAKKNPNKEYISTDISPASGFIPSLNLTAVAFRFYGGGSVAVPYNERVYSTRFRSSTTQIIWYEIHLRNSAAQAHVEFDIDAVWYRQDGTVVNRATREASFGPYSTFIKKVYTQGLRFYQPNNWIPGSYRVDLFIAGKKVASGSFEVY